MQPRTLLPGLFYTLLPVLTWFPYFLFSKQVKETFCEVGRMKTMLTVAEFDWHFWR